MTPATPVTPMTPVGATAMHIKWLKHGSGAASRAASYVIDAKDARGVERERVEVLRGDPERVADVADSLDFAHRYQSAVVSWSPDDAPTDDQVEAVLADFETAMLAQFGDDAEPDRLAWTAVRHEEGGTHLHILAARVDLVTGKSYAPAPPGWERLYDPIRDYHNHAHGWARPDDPARARLVQTGHEALRDATAVRAGIEGEGSESAKAQITEWLTARIEAGEIADREGIRASLQELGEITREGNNYISVRPEGASRAIRLRGAIYGSEFDAAAIRDAAPEAGAGRGAVRQTNAGEADRAWREFGEACQRFAERSQGRYAIRDESPGLDPAPAPERDREPDRELAGDASAGGETVAVGHAPASADRSDRLPDYVRHDLGLVADEQALDGGADEQWPGIPSDGGWLDDLRDGVGRDAAMQAEAGWLDRLNEAVRGVHDRARETVGRWVATAVEAVRAGYEAAAGADRALATAGADVERAGAEAQRAASQGDRRIGRGLQRMSQHRADELEAFKSQINLAEYIASQGYQLDRRESSRNSAVMRRGDDKLIVATDQDGHGIYFSVRDDADHGSIIDFVQRRQGLNLGQTRKELRPWIGDSSSYRPIPERIHKPAPSTADRRSVIAAFTGMQPQPSGGHPYLLGRGLAPETLEDSRFAGMIRQDSRGNAVFPHYDRAGLSGYELKNDGFTGFSKGGEKRLWHSSNLAHAERVVVVESAIDAMSHAQATGDGESAYISIGGQPSREQWDLIGSALKKSNERGAAVVIATDADAAGDALAERIAALAPGAERQRPDRGKDWNDQLQAQQQPGPKPERAPESERQPARPGPKQDSGMSM